MNDYKSRSVDLTDSDGPYVDRTLLVDRFLKKNGEVVFIHPPLAD